MSQLLLSLPAYSSLVIQHHPIPDKFTKLYYADTCQQFRVKGFGINGKQLAPFVAKDITSE